MLYLVVKLIHIFLYVFASALLLFFRGDAAKIVNVCSSSIPCGGILGREVLGCYSFFPVDILVLGTKLIIAFLFYHVTLRLNAILILKITGTTLDILRT
jgi:hypothetical protein